jgi:hypothetical protein
VERKIGWGGKLFIRALCCLRNVWPTKSLVSFVQDSKLHWFGTVYGRSPVRPPGSTSPTRQLSGKPREHGGASAFKLDHYWREVDCIAVPLPNVIARVSTLRAKKWGPISSCGVANATQSRTEELKHVRRRRQPLAQRPSKHRVAGWTRTGQDRARARLPIRPVKAQSPLSSAVRRLFSFPVSDRGIENVLRCSLRLRDHAKPSLSHVEPNLLIVWALGSICHRQAIASMDAISVCVAHLPRIT